MAVYFCGSDLFNCLKISSDNDSGKLKGIFSEPIKLENIVNLEYGNFYAVYQKKGVSSWYVTAIGLEETEIFTSECHVREVCASKNLIVGLSENGELLKRKVDVCEDDLSLKLDCVEKIDGMFRKICCNDLCIYGLAFECCSELCKIYKIEEEGIECVGEFCKNKIVDFSVGNGHFVAMSDTGALWNWGHCGRSELAGCNEVSKMSVCEKPKRIEFFDDLESVVIKVICGGWHTLALTSDGDIYSWGWNESGQLGHGDVVSSKSEPYPIDLGSADDPVVDIAAGSRHSVALLKSGLVYSWGRNVEGQAGYGNPDLVLNSKPQLMKKTWDGCVVNVKCGKWASLVCIQS